jgi:hypothetical protein
MKDRVIRMMIGARDEAAVVVERRGNEQQRKERGRGKKEGGLWNIVERGKWRLIVLNRGVALGEWNTYLKKRARAREEFASMGKGFRRGTGFPFDSVGLRQP